jgi:hypothetical protein
VRVERDVTITLTESQVAQVAREALGDDGLSVLLAELGDRETLSSRARSIATDDRYSQALLRALLVLLAFPADGSERELTDVARQLELSPSTAHRYARTWVELGLVEQDARSRRYRRVRL